MDEKEACDDAQIIIISSHLWRKESANLIIIFA